MAEKWNSEVNQKFYGLTAYILKSKTTNTSKLIYSFKLKMDDRNMNSEYQKFLFWYNQICLSGLKSFYFPDFISHNGLREYKMAATPSFKGYAIKEVSLSFIEL